MHILLVDFETRSRVNLKDAGADVYATDPSTEILCAAFGMYGSSQTKEIWFPNEPVPQWVVDFVEKGNGLIAAHNARFDSLIWESAGMGLLPYVEPSRWYCTSAQCRVNAIPASLDDAAIALGLKTRKDHKGAALIRTLSIPQPDGSFIEDPELLKEMGAYCLQDIKVMHAIMRTTRLMTSLEHADWLVNERINDRGVMVDDYLAEHAIHYATEEQRDVGAALTYLTDGVIVKHTQTAKAKDWLRRRLPSHLAALMVKPAKKGKPEKVSLDSATRALLQDAPELPPRFRMMLSYLDAGNKSSVAKFKQMINRRDPTDGRVRGAFVYAGAVQTLRYTSRGLQLHNMRRECFKPAECEEVLDLMEARKPIETPKRSTMDTLSMLLRPALVPKEGNVFVVGDWSAIEARALPWLAKSRGAERVLDRFRNDEDIYMATATAMGFEDRQLGKVAVLSLGFAGGVGAFDAMAVNYGVNLPEEQKADVVRKWRETNQWAVTFWAQVESAAMQAMRRPNEIVPAGRVGYVFNPDLIGGTLICILPSGQTIQYPQARVEMLAPSYESTGDAVPTLTALKANLPKSPDAVEWTRVNLWKGLLVENICQAVCADLLRCALRVLDGDGVKVVMHTHDEIIAETDVKSADQVAKKLQGVMEAAPEWAEGLPLNAEPETMLRYGK